MEPVQEFKTLSEAKSYLNEWKHILFLDDWIISLRLVDGTEIPGLCGQTQFDFVHRSSVIQLARMTDDIRSRIVKVPHEKTLVHELLHLKYGWVACDGSYEGKYLDTLEHGLLDQMACSLIMAKYELDYSWFNNIKE